MSIQLTTLNGSRTILAHTNGEPTAKAKGNQIRPEKTSPKESVRIAITSPKDI